MTATAAAPRALPKPPREILVTRSLGLLAPKFRAALERVVARMRELELDPFIFETLRTHQRQQFLYGFGREYDDGRGIVTHSRDADETWHGYGLAADIISASQLWSAPRRFWTALGGLAEAEGLLWGGNWDRNIATAERFPDVPHVQWGAPMRRSPSPRAARLRDAGGNAAVWAEVNAQ